MCNTSSHRFDVSFFGHHLELRLRTTNIKRAGPKVSQEEVHEFFQHFKAGRGCSLIPTYMVQYLLEKKRR
jgi:hypothetical protein